MHLVILRGYKFSIFQNGLQQTRYVFLRENKLNLVLKRKKIDCRKYQHKKDRFLFWCARIWVPTLEHWYNSIKIHLDTSMFKFKQSDKRFLWSKLPLYLIYHQGQIQTKSKILLMVWAPIKGAQNKFMTPLILHYSGAHLELI